MRNLELTFWICVSILGVYLFTGCSSLTPLQRQEVKIAKYEAKLARIKADTLSIQRTDNTYRQTGWNIWWNDPFRFNRWGWHNQVYRPQIIIPLNRRRNNGNYNRNNTRPSRTVPNNRSNVRGSRGQNRPVVKPRQTVRPPSLPVRKRRGTSVNHTQQKNNYIRKSQAVPTNRKKH